MLEVSSWLKEWLALLREQSSTDVSLAELACRSLGGIIWGLGRGVGGRGGEYAGGARVRCVI